MHGHVFAAAKVNPKPHTKPHLCNTMQPYTPTHIKPTHTYTHPILCTHIKLTHSPPTLHTLHSTLSTAPT